ncbi:MAG: isopentenyl phosphate kinase [bacterium]|nr:isopentenyl phosphate kinase [bacterium]
MNKLLFIKLGGSLITDKTVPELFQLEQTQHVAQQIKFGLENKECKLIIGNGAGSFGHYSVLKYDLTKGIKTEDQKEGFCVVHQSVVKLNQLVVDELLKFHVNAFAINPSSILISNNNDTKLFFTEPIVEMLDRNIIPVLFGDIIIDEKIGSCVYSTERLFVELILELKKYHFDIKIIYAGITDGVFGSDGKTISHINNNNWNSIKKEIFTTKGFDVTGGMLHKVEQSLLLAKQGVETHIIDARMPNDNLYKAMRNEFNGGTIIE